MPSPSQMPYTPPYKITPKILSLVASISEAVAGEKSIELKDSPQLRKQNQIKTIAGTLVIEGNTLSLEQVSAIVDGKQLEARKGKLPKFVGQLRHTIGKQYYLLLVEILNK